METAPTWVIALAKPSAEDVAERYLRQAGYRVYLPRYRKLLRPHGTDRRGQPSMRPLFVGYLFVHDWRGWPGVPINGVSGIMKSAGRNVEMLDADVQTIWQRERDGAFDEVPTPHVRTKRTDLQVGDTVEYEFLGRTVLAVLDDLTDSGKAIVRGMMFSRETTWTVDADALHAISA